MGNGGLGSDAGSDDAEGTSGTDEDLGHGEGTNAFGCFFAVEKDANSDDFDTETDDLEELVSVGPTEDEASDDTKYGEADCHSVVEVRPIADGPILHDEDEG